MPSAKETFESSIRDAVELLEHFNAINATNAQAPPPNAEVLKRAGLIMACTAWETYVEDRVQEVVQQRLGEGNDSFQNKFFLRHLSLALKQFNNPNTEKTCKLFSDYLGIDVAAAWVWNNYDAARAKTELDTLIKKRGEAVHRSKPPSAGVPAAHLIRKEELEKAIRFLRSLVEATDRATAP